MAHGLPHSEPHEQALAHLRLQCLELAIREGGADPLVSARKYAAFVLDTPDDAQKRSRACD